jgi:hypothetical protein
MGFMTYHTSQAERSGMVFHVEREKGAYMEKAVGQHSHQDLHQREDLELVLASNKFISVTSGNGCLSQLMEWKTVKK